MSPVTPIVSAARSCHPCSPSAWTQRTFQHCRCRRRCRAALAAVDAPQPSRHATFQRRAAPKIFRLDPPRPQSPGRTAAAIHEGRRTSGHCRHHHHRGVVHADAARPPRCLVRCCGSPGPTRRPPPSCCSSQIRLRKGRIQAHRSCSRPARVPNRYTWRLSAARGGGGREGDGVHRRCLGEPPRRIVQPPPGCAPQPPLSRRPLRCLR